MSYKTLRRWRSAFSKREHPTTKTPTPMLKNLPLHSIHQQILADFKIYLKAKGYQEETSLLSGVKEFMFRMEKEGKKLQEIGREDLENHYEYLLNRPSYRDGGGLSNYTVNGYLYSLRLFFDYLEKVELLSVNPMSSLSFKLDLKSERVLLEKKEVEQLYKACMDEQERAILGLFYGCGLRRKEAEMLNLKDVDFSGSWLYVRSGKGKKRRVIPLTRSVASDIKQYIYNQRISQETSRTKAADEKALMLNKDGTRMSGGSYWKYFKRLLERSKVKKQASLHHLRHSIASHLLESGMSIEEVRDFLGHDHLETTQIYTQVKTSQLKIN
jgi:integrase/recombinase XerD